MPICTSNNHKPEIIKQDRKKEEIRGKKKKKDTEECRLTKW